MDDIFQTMFSNSHKIVTKKKEYHTFWEYFRLQCFSDKMMQLTDWQDQTMNTTKIGNNYNEIITNETNLLFERNVQFEHTVKTHIPFTTSVGHVHEKHKLFAIDED